MTGIRDLFSSGHGLFCMALLVIATIFICVGVMSDVQWCELAKVLAVTSFGAHTVTAGARALAARKGTNG